MECTYVDTHTFLDGVHIYGWSALDGGHLDTHTYLWMDYTYIYMDGVHQDTHTYHCMEYT